jgi:CubicO group peptidase (beta-lactamase class C family)
LLSLDEPVDRPLPELAGARVQRHIDGPLHDTVPAVPLGWVRELLTFTFGFGAAVEMFISAEPWPFVKAADEVKLCTLGPPSPAEQPDPDIWVAVLESLPLLGQPGERWLYNTGASVLGVLVARAAGMSFGEVLHTWIFQALAMADTALFSEDTERLATAYRPTELALEVWDPPEGLEQCPGLRRWSGGARVDSRRSARFRPHALSWGGRGTGTGERRRDDARSAQRGTETSGRPRVPWRRQPGLVSR